MKTIRRLFSVSIISAGTFIIAFIFSFYLMFVILDLKDLSLQTWKVRTYWNELSSTTNDILYLRLDSVGHVSTLKEEWIQRSEVLDAALQELLNHPKVSILPQNILDELQHSRYIWYFSIKRLHDAQTILDTLFNENLLIDGILANGEPSLYENIMDLTSSPGLSYEEKLIYNKFTANMNVFNMTKNEFSSILQMVNQEIPPLLDKKIFQLTLFTLLLFLLAILYTLFSLSRTVQPLTRLAKTVKNMEHMDQPVFLDSLDIHDALDDDDEIMIIKRGVSQMGRKISDLYEESLRVEKEKQQAQLQALQYQINPHFLYNTLGSLQLSAAMNNQKELADTLRSLSRMLRNTIRRTKNRITLAEEIEIVKDYLAIMQFRYRNRLSIGISIPDTLLQQPIPGQIIQPILENAIQHGLHEALNSETASPEISITAASDSRNIILSIADNGTGMEESEIAKIFSETRDAKEDGSTHIGLKNINDRIQIQFGASYGISITSAPDRGTTVTLTLPLSQES